MQYILQLLRYHITVHCLSNCFKIRVQIVTDPLAQSKQINTHVEWDLTNFWVIPCQLNKWSPGDPLQCTSLHSNNN